MKKVSIICFIALICFSSQIFGQVGGDKKTVEVFVNKPAMKKTFIRIVKAEDELRFDETLEEIMRIGNPFERARAALAAGRIGDEAAIPFLEKLLENDASAKVRAMAAFALGEIESVKAADAILKVLNNKGLPDELRSRAVEAAGKIAAANPKAEKAKILGEAVLDALEYEDAQGAKQSRDIILLGITAALRAKPEEADSVVAKFLTNLDARIRADAANTLSRLRSKNFDEKFRAMLLTDDDPIARANAARALGAAEDKEAADLLMTAATTDQDSRVRVSAIRSLGNLKDEKSAEKLLERGENLLADHKKSKFANSIEQNELLEIATALGQILKYSEDKKTLDFLIELDKAENYKSAEIEIALARVSPKKFQQLQREKNFGSMKDWQIVSADAQGTGELANLENSTENEEIKRDAIKKLFGILADALEPKDGEKSIKVELFPALPETLRAYAAFKPNNLAEVLRKCLRHKDVFVRATTVELLSEQTAAKENTQALKTAFVSALKTDKNYNDAQLAILSALVKLDKKESIESLKLALDAPDFLVRKHAANLIEENNLTNDFPNLKEKVGTLKPYDAKTGTKLGQILNTEAEYTRAVSRENGTVKAILTTEKGKLTISLLPEDAPLTVDNFIKLAKLGYFNNVAIHRVVANFVVQDGDPRGDGNGGPGWQIRDEMNTVPFERGAVGMALSGKNTGGSQWFITHSPQPHLDGGYTVFGKVNETDMKVVDNLVRGDKILKVEIVEEKPTTKKIEKVSEKPLKKAAKKN